MSLIKDESKQRWRRIIVLITIGVVSATACNSDSPDPAPPLVRGVLDEVISSTQIAGSSEIRGELNTAGITEKVTGRWSTSDDGGDIGSVESTLHIGAELSLAAEIRWIDGTDYFLRTDFVGMQVGDLGLLDLFVRRREADSEWGSVLLPKNAERLVAQFTPFYPIRLLKLLQLRGAKLEVATSDAEEEGGLAHYRVEKLAGAVLNFLRPSVDIWVTADSRLARVRIQFDEAWLDYELVNFGVEVTVTPPTAEQLKQGTADDDIELAEPFVAVIDGAFAEVAWTLSRAMSTAGFPCWRIAPAEQIVVKSPNGPEASRCLAAISAEDDLVDQVLFLITTEADSALTALVVRSLPAATNANVGFIGGELRQMKFDDGLLVYVGEDIPLYLSLEIGGALVECGAGAVSQVSDLRDPTVTQSSVGNPWVCAVA